MSSAEFGYCVSRKLYYFGYKLVMVTKLNGIPVVYDMVPANTDERQAAEAVIDPITNATLLGDKGFLGVEWQDQMHQQAGTTVVTPKRKNQKIQQPDGFEALLNSVRVNHASLALPYVSIPTQLSAPLITPQIAMIRMSISL